MDISSLYNLYLKAGQVSTDTRKIKEGDLFFALKGENFNGNKFAKAALEKGASFAIIDEAQPNMSKQFILVNDVLNTLQKLANFHRKKLNIPVVAITGSNGKTTTKELTARVLAQKFEVFATPGNFNNHIGVPLTLLMMTAQTEIAVIELGDNHLGEIRTLCEIAEPNCGVITNIGKDHIEGYGSFEGNLRAKSELFQYLLQTGGTAFINSADSILTNMAKRFEKPIFYGENGNFSSLNLLEANPFIHYQDEEGKMVKTQLVGSYNMENIQTAYCIGKYFEVPSEKMNKAIASYIPTNNRSQIVEKGSNTIFLDAYNANPSSVEVALKSFAQVETEKSKAVILGDMFELGNISEEEHLKTIQLALSLPFGQIIFCGKNYYHHKSDKAIFFEGKEHLIHYLEEEKFQNYYFLLKGSRSMALESLLVFLEA